MMSPSSDHLFGGYVGGMSIFPRHVPAKITASYVKWGAHIQVNKYPPQVIFQQKHQEHEEDESCKARCPGKRLARPFPSLNYRSEVPTAHPPSWALREHPYLWRATVALLSPLHKLVPAHWPPVQLICPRDVQQAAGPGVPEELPHVLLTAAAEELGVNQAEGAQKQAVMSRDASPRTLTPTRPGRSCRATNKLKGINGPLKYIFKWSVHPDLTILWASPHQDSAGGHLEIFAA